MIKPASILTTRPRRITLILIFIAVSLCVSQYYFSKRAVITGQNIEYKIATFSSLLYGVDNYKMAVDYAWRSRILSTGAATLFILFKNPRKTRDVGLEEFSSWIATYNALWLAGCFLLIIGLSKKPLLWIFGLFGAMMYAWTPTAQSLLFPWDGPSLFFWVLISFMAMHKYRYAVFVIVPLAMGFKETAIVAAIIPLFWRDLPLKSRILKFGMLLVCCVIIKITIDVLLGNPIPFFTMETHFEYRNKVGYYSLIEHNIHMLFFKAGLNNPYFINGGVLIALFLLSYRRGVWMYKSMALGFCSIIMICGVVNEARIFHELIPLFFISIERLYPELM